jgi:hypothetical protein
VHHPLARWARGPDLPLQPRDLLLVLDGAHGAGVVPLDGGPAPLAALVGRAILIDG